MSATSVFSKLFSVNGMSNTESCSSKSRATRRLTFDDTSQAFTISNLTKKSVEDTNISVQVSFPQQMLFYFHSLL